MIRYLFGCGGEISAPCIAREGIEEGVEVGCAMVGNVLRPDLLSPALL